MHACVQGSQGYAVRRRRFVESDRERERERLDREAREVRPVEFHPRSCARRGDRVRIAALLRSSCVTGCHAQESLFSRFRLSDRVIVRTPKGDRTNMRPPWHAGCWLRTHVTDCFNTECSLSLEKEMEERERERERGVDGWETDTYLVVCD